MLWNLPGYVNQKGIDPEGLESGKAAERLSKAFGGILDFTERSAGLYFERRSYTL